MNSFGDLASNPILDGLIAATLYAATYLSFIRLLRFPRNWLLPSQKEILITGLLGLLTVGWVTLSSTGPDLLRLVITSSFLFTIALIIAAPSICFRPANRPVEFFAKHSEHAALWILGPTLFICWVMPASKLQSMLLAAMAIELVWLFRQYSVQRKREIYPLTPSDRSVLNAHAKGDLKAFRRHNGISELLLSEKVINWKGCSKDTPPCPFNLYVNRLGLNTAPCCRKHMQDISHYVSDSLLQIGVTHWLEGGSLLGAVRENGKLLDWEDDIDISILLNEDTTWERLSAQLVEQSEKDGYFVNSFQEAGLITVSFDAPRPWPFRWERNRLRGEIRVDIAVYRKVISHGAAVLERRSPKGIMPDTEYGGYGVPLGVVLPTSEINFEGRSIACPKNSDAYLRLLYGDYEEIKYTYINPVAAQNR